ncbi:MAG: TPM domain-containing protein [Betaproteobacteria bacterium]|nr:TPM domain-containing protein [Betaproteobacteria bacterium]
MNLARIWRHILMNRWTLNRAFSPSVLQAIQTATAQQEQRHRGEIRFVVEAELDWGSLIADAPPRHRAIQVFGGLRVWDTEENNGILIYVLLADHDIEIVADRGIHRQVGDEAWRRICDAMRAEFKAGRFEQGAVQAIAAISDLLAQHFPPRGDDQNELSDQPVVI